MRLSARALLAMLGVFVLPFVLFLGWTELDLRPQMERRVEDGLEREARLVRLATADEPLTDSLADRLGSTLGLRVTLVATDGTVVGDSDVPESRLPSVENHANRAEVRAALGGESGTAVRASATVARRLLYVAVPDPRGVIRLAVPLDAVDAVVTRSRQWVLAGGLVVAILVLLVGRRLQDIWLRPVEEIRNGVAAMAAGEFGRTVRAGGGGLLAPLAAEVNRTTARLSERIDALLREKTDLQVLFNVLDDGVALVDEAAIVQRANRAFEHWLGRPDLNGEHIATLFRDPANRQAIEKAIHGERVFHESRLGDQIVLLSTRPHAGGALVILRDLTHTRQLENVRSDFVANVSHELKTPLTNVRGFGEAIAGDPGVPPGAREFADRIVANAKRMEALVDDLLDLSRIESGAWTPLRAELDLEPLARDVWQSVEPRGRQKGVSLTVEISPDVRVAADPDAMRQILRNLFDNAVRYAPEGTTVRLSVGVAAGSPDRPAIRIAVADEGPGIPYEHRERVFERFYRVDEARSREAGGTGLGLSIVKHLVASHGGEVGLESEVGGGTTVWFTLPAAAD